MDTFHLCRAPYSRIHSDNEPEFIAKELRQSPESMGEATPFLAPGVTRGSGRQQPEDLG